VLLVSVSSPRLGIHNIVLSASTELMVDASVLYCYGIPLQLQMYLYSSCLCYLLFFLFRFLLTVISNDNFSCVPLQESEVVDNTSGGKKGAIKSGRWVKTH